MASSSTTSMRPSPPSAAGSTPAPTALRGEDDPASLKEFGSSTTVPQNDICRLSYYLKCCILGCGFREASIALPVEVIMDYNNAHRLPSSLQRAIYHIVMSDFHPQTLMNRVFFVDDSSTLLEPDTMNAFFEWSTTISRALRMAEQGSGGMGIGVISDEQGQHAPSPNVLRKLMVCTSSWLNEYCILPLYRVSERLAMSALSFSSIAAAASGGGCGETSAAPNARDHSASLFLSEHQEGQYGGGSEQHPRAFSSRNAARFCCAATCTCRQNPRTSSASPPVDNEQYHAHEVVCGGRDCVAGGASTPIRGPRYRCKVCPNFDQCEICYNDLAGHDQTHAFEMIASRTCIRPRLLQARVQAVTECCSSTLYNNDRQEDVPVAFAVPVLPHQEIEKEDDGTDGLVVPVKRKHKRRRLS